MSSPKTSAAAAAAAASLLPRRPTVTTSSALPGTYAGPSSASPTEVDPTPSSHRHVRKKETAPVTTHAAGVGSGRLLCSSRSAPPGSLSLCSHFLCLVVFGFSGARKKTSLTSLIESFTT
ncbi:hypothetical protein VDGD_20192 [Verticillium dahliae]|nr:hypothetical protein VDGD_20192 [Verticillium dahliae]